MYFVYKAELLHVLHSNVGERRVYVKLQLYQKELIYYYVSQRCLVYGKSNVSFSVSVSGQCTTQDVPHVGIHGTCGTG